MFRATLFLMCVLFVPSEAAACETPQDILAELTDIIQASIIGRNSLLNHATDQWISLAEGFRHNLHILLSPKADLNEFSSLSAIVLGRRLTNQLSKVLDQTNEHVDEQITVNTGRIHSLLNELQATEQQRAYVASHLKKMREYQWSFEDRMSGLNTEQKKSIRLVVNKTVSDACIAWRVGDARSVILAVTAGGDSIRSLVASTIEMVYADLEKSRIELKHHTKLIVQFITGLISHKYNI